MKLFAVALTLALAMSNSQAKSAPKAPMRVYTSGYSNVVATFDFAEGNLTPTGEGPVATNMTFTQIVDELHTLFAIHEVTQSEGFGATGTISRWNIHHDKAGAAPTFERIQEVTSSGESPCFITVDRNLGFLHVANYGDTNGSYTAYKINSETGEIGSMAFTKNFGLGSNVHPDRQAYSHPHGVFTYKNYVFVTDLGCDKIWHFEVKNNEIVEANPAYTELNPGYGPRHLVVDHVRGMLFVLCELKSVIITYKISDSNGALELITTTELLAESPIPPNEQTWPFNYAAEIYIHPNNNILYATNRATGAIVTFAIQEEGTLQFVQYLPVAGTIPRHFRIYPDGQYIIVALQDTNILETFQVDQTTGALTKLSEYPSNNTPTIVDLF